MVCSSKLLETHSLPSPATLLQDVAYSAIPMQHEDGPGVLHVLLKALQADGMVQVRGIVYFDKFHGIEFCRPRAGRVAPGPWRGNSSAAPMFSAHRVDGPPVTLHRVAHDPVTPKFPCMPLMLQANLPGPAEQWQVHVAGTPYVVPLQPAAKTAVHTQPRFHTLIGTRRTDVVHFRSYSHDDRAVHGC